MKKLTSQFRILIMVMSLWEKKIGPACLVPAQSFFLSEHANHR
jgi:hypothetical protein